MSGAAASSSSASALLSEVWQSVHLLFFQLLELPPPHSGASVPGALGSAGEGSAVLGLGGLEIPEERERIKALISALHWKTGILYRLSLPHCPSLVCLKGGSLKNDNSHSSF